MYEYKIRELLTYGLPNEEPYRSYYIELFIKEHTLYPLFEDVDL